MPTRLVLKESAVPSQKSIYDVGIDLSADSTVTSSKRRLAHIPIRGPRHQMPQHAAPLDQTPEPRTPSPTPNRTNSASLNTVRRSASAMLLGNSILKELAVRPDDSDDEQIKEDGIRLSTDDIRASPRLLGYLFGCITSAVMLVSVVKFYYNVIKMPNADLNPVYTKASSPSLQQQDADLSQFYVFSFGFVYRWKLWGSIYISAANTFLYLVSCIVHFDTFCFPKVWQIIFCDGSYWEGSWIAFLLLLAAAEVHICTSSFSVGQFQANVFFTTWIGFAAAVSNFYVWRESAGLLPFTEQIHNRGRKLRRKEHQREASQTQPQGHFRETTDNWLYTAFFSAVFCGSITDMYMNREELTFLRSESFEELIITSHDWVIILSVVWSEFIVCLLAILLNECFVKTSWMLPCSCHAQGTSYRAVVGWRQIEGFVILAGMGGKLWIIIKYTGVDAVVNGLDNAYFGVWGSFFNSAFTFGTWVKEKKNINWIIREGSEDNE